MKTKIMQLPRRLSHRLQVYSPKSDLSFVLILLLLLRIYVSDFTNQLRNLCHTHANHHNQHNPLLFCRR